MDNNVVTMAFHEEYAKRVEEENKRQNRRLDKLEKAVGENANLALSIERLTISVKNMVEEQRAQGTRLEALENRDGEKWRKVASYVLTTIIGIILGYIFKQFGM